MHFRVLRVSFALLITVTLAGAARAQVIADLRSNYDAAAGSFTNGATSSGLIAGHGGSGNWNFYSATSAAGAGLTLLTYTTAAGAGTRLANAFVSPGNSTYDFPAWTNNVFFAQAGQGTPSANELTVHPGDTSPLYAGALWTSGYTGSVTLTGAIRDLGFSTDGVTLDILVNGSGIFSSGATSGNTAIAFNQTFSVTPGTTVLFLVGKNGNFSDDQSALSATITAVPEPSSFAALAGAAALGALVLQRRRRLQPAW